ncbi:hypothetical protein Tco_0053050 [Tanacetum coccineum]
MRFDVFGLSYNTIELKLGLSRILSHLVRMLSHDWKRISHKKMKNQAKSDKTGHEMEKMGLLDFVKSADPFKVKVGEQTLAENEVPLIIETGDRVISPSLSSMYTYRKLLRLQSSILPFLDKLLPIVTVCSGYSGWIATLIPSMAAGSLGGRTFCVSATILHFAGIMVLLQIVTIPPSIGNFSIP